MRLRKSGSDVDSERSAQQALGLDSDALVWPVSGHKSSGCARNLLWCRDLPSLCFFEIEHQRPYELLLGSKADR